MLNSQDKERRPALGGTGKRMGLNLGQVSSTVSDYVWQNSWASNALGRKEVRKDIASSPLGCRKKPKKEHADGTSKELDCMVGGHLSSVARQNLRTSSLLLFFSSSEYFQYE